MRQAGSAGARQGRVAQALCSRPCAAWACCWASRLCTRCTQPVLSQFRLSTVPESIFRENFFEKKKIILEKKNQIKNLDKIFEIKINKIFKNEIFVDQNDLFKMK